MNHGGFQQAPLNVSFPDVLSAVQILERSFVELDVAAILPNAGWNTNSVRIQSGIGSGTVGSELKVTLGD